MAYLRDAEANEVRRLLVELEFGKSNLPSTCWEGVALPTYPGIGIPVYPPVGGPAELVTRSRLLIHSTFFPINGYVIVSGGSGFRAELNSKKNVARAVCPRMTLSLQVSRETSLNKFLSRSNALRWNELAARGVLTQR